MFYSIGVICALRYIDHLFGFLVELFESTARIKVVQIN